MKGILALAVLSLLVGCVPASGGGQVAYLSPVDAPEIWRTSLTGGEPRRLTDSGGMIYDFAVWPDGTRIVYAAGNDLGGTDLWTISAGGGKARLLLDCGGDRCSGPAVSPDGRKVAYQRRNTSENPGGDPGLARLWLIETASGSTQAVYRDARISCEQPAWAPDGARLSCYDVKEGAIRVHTLTGDGNAKDDRLFATLSAQPGCWSPDGGSLFYAKTDYDLEAPVARVYRGDVASGGSELVHLLADVIDISSMALSPEGNRLAFSVLLVGEGQGKDLWILNLDRADSGEAVTVIENSPHESLTACRWSSDGRRLVCQQLTIGASEGYPWLVVWDLEENVQTVAARNAALPAWLYGLSRLR